MTPPGFALVAYKWSLSGDNQDMVSTVGVDLNANNQSLQAQADALADKFTAGFGAAEFMTGWTYKGVTLRVGQPGGGTAVAEAPRNVAGTFNAETPPQNCSLLIKKLTAVAGRRNRGRMYLPPFCITESAVTKNGQILAQNVTDIQTNLNQWLGSDFAWVLLHGDLPAPLAPTPISAFVLDNVIATQRRRLRR